MCVCVCVCQYVNEMNIKIENLLIYIMFFFSLRNVSVSSENLVNFSCDAQFISIRYGQLFHTGMAAALLILNSYLLYYK